jgi:hypothetical protein
VRRDVASYIQERDGGIPADYQDIYLSTGDAKITAMSSYAGLNLKTLEIM